MKATIDKLVTAFCIILISIFTVQSAFSQWIQSDGPYGNTNIHSLITVDSLLITGTTAGYFSKTELSDKWTFHSTENFISHTRMDDELYFCELYEGIKKINLSNLDDEPVILNEWSDFNSLTNKDGLLFGGSEEYGFHVSVNSGLSWEDNNSGLPTDTVWYPWGTVYESQVYCMAITDEFMYCDTNEGIYRITDPFGTWEEINEGFPMLKVNLIHATEGSLFASTYEELYRSNDAGVYNSSDH